MTAYPLSVQQTAAAPELSSRYVHVNSMDVIASMHDAGFVVHAIKAAAKTEHARLFGRHEIDFRHADAPVHVNGYVPRMLFVNSHDGSTKATALMGVYRFVCSNGLVVGNSMHRETLRHAGDAARTLVERMQALAKNTAPLFGQIDRWTKTPMPRVRAREFARMAAHLRWGDADKFDVEDLLQVRRGEDDAGDLWTTFNRIQENTTRGDLAGVTRSGRATRARPLQEIVAANRYNSQLWELAEAFSNI